MEQAPVPAVLIVEDDPVSARIIEQVFRKTGMPNPRRVVKDGEQAISYLAGLGEYGDRDRFPFPALVLLDIWMPRKTGHDVLAWIRGQESLKDLPVIVLTSSNNTSDIEKAYELGANSYLLKPMTSESLKEVMDIFAKPMTDSPKFLMLDDDQDMRNLAIKLLKREFPGIRIVQVGTADELPGALEEGGYDLVITDYELKWTNGLKLLRIVKARWPECPVIMFTGSGSEEVAVEALRAGLDDYVLKKTNHIARLPGAARLVLARSRHRQEAREAEKRYRSLFESVPVGLFRCTTEGRLTDANPAFIRMFGCPDAAAVQTLSLAESFVEKEDLKRWVERIRSEEKVHDFETRLFRMDKAVIWVEMNVHTVCDSYDKPLYYEGIIQDITERKNLESQLRQALKMEAIGTLAGGVAHDFNNILTAIIGYGTLLQMQLGEDNPLRIYADQILSSSQKAAGLTHSLLAFSRKQPIALKPVKLNNIIKGTDKLLKRLLTEDITFKTVLSPDDITIMCDVTQIDQILFNLVSNARDVMPKGGELAIETRLVELDKSFIEVFGYGEPGMYALLSVSDTGSGMNEKTKEKIFDPFFTTKEVGKGTGLGLSTVYGIVKQHNGYINVYSEIDQGTTFHLFFPSTASVVSKMERPPADLEKGREKILLAEDNTEVRKLIMKVLTDNGYTVIEAADGEEAVKKFKENQDVDILLLDSVMPNKNGREAYDEMRELKPSIKALFTSGYTRDIILNEAIKAKDFHFISKPIVPLELLHRLKEILKG